MRPPPRKTATQIAVVEDDPGVIELIRCSLEEENVQVDAYESAQTFLDRAELDDYDLILCDLNLPGMSGIDLLLEVRDRTSQPRFVIITGQGSVTAAVHAMKAGATDFIQKPFRVDELVSLVRSCAKPAAAAHDAEGEAERSFAVGVSTSWKELLQRARRVADLPTTVLIRGETGSGKEVLARYIGAFGPRAGKAFVALNCAALPDHLVESELFGHAKGAFSGAETARRGLFEEAGGGTLFLDEVGTLPLAAQAKLLRALEERQIRRVGDNKTIPVDVRILAATNLDVEAAVARHEFRPDLYFRLSVVSLTIPSLRDRREDIPILARHFLKALQGPGTTAKQLSPEALELLSRYSFPGNVRELKHAIEQAAVFANGPELLPADFTQLATRTELLSDPGRPGDSDAEDAGDVTPEILAEALKKTRGNRVEAAKKLGISRSTLYRLLRQMPADSAG